MICFLHYKILIKSFCSIPTSDNLDKKSEVSSISPLNKLRKMILVFSFLSNHPNLNLNSSVRMTLIVQTPHLINPHRQLQQKNRFLLPRFFQVVVVVVLQFFLMHHKWQHRLAKKSNYLIH